jgi:UDPglucose--hexose-1-phosphate uridylyltransferase
MADFEFIYNPTTNKWTILAPKRSKRPKEERDIIAICPFCVGEEKEKEEVYRLSGEDKNRWLVRVISNNFPFAPIHEVIVHSPDHHKNFDELPLSQVKNIFLVYKQRYLLYQEKGTVYIFNNHGRGSGESLPHPHSQLVVIPRHIQVEIPPLQTVEKEMQETMHFRIYCPRTSQWPDEVWIAPKQANKTFGEISEDELSDFSYSLQRLLQIFDIRYNYEFPHNFYIYPWRNWYLRIMPRMKKLGGFELGTNIIVNTQDPSETITFIREHFISADKEKILKEHQASYHKGV